MCLCRSFSTAEGDRGQSTPSNMNETEGHARRRRRSICSLWPVVAASHHYLVPALLLNPVVHHPDINWWSFHLKPSLWVADSVGQELAEWYPNQQMSHFQFYKWIFSLFSWLSWMSPLLPSICAGRDRSHYNVSTSQFLHRCWVKVMCKGQWAIGRDRMTEFT